MNIEYRIGDDGKHHVYLDDVIVKPGFSFTDEMLAARNDGRKTVTRRLHKKPKFAVNQIVYVKEALIEYEGLALYEFDETAVKKEDGSGILWKWIPKRLQGIYMPGEAARRFDRIVEVRAERLQEIAYEDIYCEGWNVQTSEPITDGTAGEDAFAWFKELWNSINQKHPWDSNPWVFVYRWEVIK